MPFIIPQPLPSETAPYVYFENLFSEEECKSIIELNKELKAEQAKVGSETTEGKIDLNKRVTELFWFDWSPKYDWIYRKISDCVFNANNRWWRFHLSGMNEPFQLTHYKSEESGHYDWHEDHGDSGNFLHRKISAVVLLNDEFEGGEFEFFHTGSPKEFKKGSLILFPSYKMHRVLPVKSGDRWSLVTWVNGPPFC